MTPTRLRECLNALDWTQRGLARTLGRQEGTVRQWARGAVRIPDKVAAWLITRATHAELTPPPVWNNPMLSPYEVTVRKALMPYLGMKITRALRDEVQGVINGIGDLYEVSPVQVSTSGMTILFNRIRSSPNAGQPGPGPDGT